MRIALIGANQTAITAARALIDRGHEVVLVDKHEERLEDCEENDLDCGLVHGDGSRPAVLEELGPENTDFLFCMSDSDQDNILAALAGERMGFGRVIVKFDDPDFNALCAQLGLEDVLVPSQETANAITDRVAGIESVDLAPLIHTGLRFFSFSVCEDDAGPVQNLSLPDDVRVLAVVRDGKSELGDSDTRIRKGDEVYVLCAQDRVDALRERFVDD